MRTLTRRLAPHAHTSWLVFGAVSLLVVGVAVAVALVSGGGRSGVVATAFTGLVVVVVLAACLDAILVPGNPDVGRRSGRAAGWTGAVGSGWSDGGGHGCGSGDGGGSCS